jgi:hypothetical protein
MGASLTMAAWVIGAFLGSGFGAAVMHKLSRRILHIGLTLMAAGLAGLYAVFSHVGADLGSWDLTLPLVGTGLGMGMIFVPLFDIIMGDVRDHEVGSGAAILESLQQLGASLGVAILGTIFFACRCHHIAGTAVRWEPDDPDTEPAGPQPRHPAAAATTTPRRPVRVRRG